MLNDVNVVAIDGPSGSGESSLARAVAARLGWAHLDTGAMYRAVAFAALAAGIDPSDVAGVARLVLGLDIDVSDGKVTVDGVDATVQIRDRDVTRVVPVVAANAAVRGELGRRQQEWAITHGGGVVEGRDIGSVVFPDAAVKVYLTASSAERVNRRSREIKADAAQLAAEMTRRDHSDSTRSAAPLTIAEGAIVIDTTGRSMQDVVSSVLCLVEARGTARRAR